MKTTRREWLKSVAVGAAILAGGSGCDITGEKEELARKELERKVFDDYQKQFDLQYAESEKPIVATVIDEHIGMQSINDSVNVNSTGYYTTFFGGTHSVSTSESVPVIKEESAYVIRARTEEGKIISIDVKTDRDITKEALEALVEPGTLISFPRGNLGKFNQKPEYCGYSADEITKHGYFVYRDETCFTPETQMGSKLASRIKVVSFPKKD